MHLAAGARIGHFNLIKIRRLVMRPDAYFGTMNAVKGWFSIRLGSNAAIGNRNIIGSDKAADRFWPAQLRLGTWSKITASHYVNVSESILVGNYSTIAGVGSQLWSATIHRRFVARLSSKA